MFICAHTRVRDGRSRKRLPNGSRRHPSQTRRLRSLTFQQRRLEKRLKGCDLEITSVFPLPASPSRPVHAHDAGFPPRRRLALPTPPPSFIPSGQIRCRLSSPLSPPSSPPSGPAACAGLPPDRLLHHARRSPLHVPALPWSCRGAERAGQPSSASGCLYKGRPSRLLTLLHHAEPLSSVATHSSLIFF